LECTMQETHHARRQEEPSRVSKKKSVPGPPGDRNISHTCFS
jgi:hypothetical protein